MRVGIWFSAAEARPQEQADGQIRCEWEVDLPEGWIATIATIGCLEADPPAPISTLQITLNGQAGSPLRVVDSPVRPGILSAWTGWRSVPPGHYTLGLTLLAGTAWQGLWLSNGHLPHGWPGEPPALAVDEYMLPGKVRPIPYLPPANSPLEFGERGLATHLNQQGAMGIANAKLTAVPRGLRLRYVDAEMHVMLRTETGLRRPTDVCPDFVLGLLDDHWLAPQASFSYDGVAYTVTFAAVPDAEEAADAILVRAENTTAISQPNRLVLILDGAADLALADDHIEASGETIAYVGTGAQVAIRQRPIGCADLTATVAGDMYSTPFLPSWGQGRNPNYDVAFYSGRIGWDGATVRYRLSCPPGAGYTVYLGVFSTEWGGPGQKPIYAGERNVRLRVEGSAERVTVDAGRLKAPVVARFEAVDEDGDGGIDLFSEADASVPNSVGFLNAIWVFPTGTQVDLDDLCQGRLNKTSLQFVNVGGSLPGGVVDLVLTEDWSFACAEISGAETLAPGQAATLQVALPVNHRAEMLPYSQARYWREAGEDTPAYAERLAHRHAAARLAITNPAAALDAVRQYWSQRITSPVQYQMADPAVQSILSTSVAYFQSHRLILGEQQHLPIGGGPMYYFDFSERDCGYGIVAVDLLGRHDETELLLNPYLTAKDELNNARWSLGQDEQGMWMTRAREEDTQGQVLWALGEHFMITRDMAWLARAWPRVKAGLEYIRRKRIEQKAAFPDPADPRHGLWISGTDESKSWGKMTHSYYFNYWIECALRLGVLEAEAMGEAEYAVTLRAEHTDFIDCLHRSLSQMFWRIDYRRGALPNAAELPDSSNPWGVQESLYPSQSVTPWDPMVGQTLAYCDALAYPRVGGLTLGPRMLWPSAGCDFAMMHLRRGEGDKVVDIFYSMVASCGLVNTWGETNLFSNGLTTGEQPYTWGNACFVILLRQMLLHESGDWLQGQASGPRELWLGTATPRKWLADPAGISVQAAPSYFGPISFTSCFDAARRQCTAVIELTADRLPERLVMHFRTPLGANLQRVTVNGSDHPYFTGEKVLIAKPPARLEIVAQL
jgi:hypothetical protein